MAVFDIKGTTGSKGSNRTKRNSGLVLFALPFLLVGLGAVGAGPVATLSQHLSSAGWGRVPATLERVETVSHRGKDSTTYSVEAFYRYRYQGRDYAGSRVGYDWGSDNIGDWISLISQGLMRAAR